jgi:hypothetical protein
MQQVWSDWVAFRVSWSVVLGNHVVAVNCPVKCVTDESLKFQTYTALLKWIQPPSQAYTYVQGGSNMTGTQFGLFTQKSVPVIFESPCMCILHSVAWPGKLAQAGKPMPCIREVFDSSFGRDTVYIDSGISLIYQCLKENSGRDCNRFLPHSSSITVVLK